MEELLKLLQIGKELLNKVTCLEFNQPLEGELAASIKSFHVRGRLMLKKIDKITFDEYSNLFAKHSESNFRWDYWKDYMRTELEKCIGILTAISESDPNIILDTSLAKIFISHGKFSPVFEKLEQFIRAIGCIPIYDTSEPSEGRTINEHVNNLIAQADFYIILATYETTDNKGIKLPNHNVIIEYDRLLQLRVDNIIILLEEGCHMPSMLQDVIHSSFDNNCMDKAFIKLAAELNRHGLL